MCLASDFHRVALFVIWEEVEACFSRLWSNSWSLTIRFSAHKKYIGLQIYFEIYWVFVRREMLVEPPPHASSGPDQEHGKQLLALVVLNWQANSEVQRVEAQNVLTSVPNNVFTKWTNSTTLDLHFDLGTVIITSTISTWKVVGAPKKSFVSSEKLDMFLRLIEIQRFYYLRRKYAAERSTSSGNIISKKQFRIIYWSKIGQKSAIIYDMRKVRFWSEPTT